MGAIPVNQSRPAVVAWADAKTHLLAQAGRRPQGSRTVVGVTGPVGAGKSALAQSLSRCVVATDNYLPNYDDVPYEDRDDPNLADFTRLADDLAALREGRAARVPVWSFQTHRREGEQEVHPADLVVVEGIHALHGAAAGLLDIAVFVESPRSVRWARWAWLETTGQRGWGVEVAREFFDRVAEPTFERFAPAYRARADVIVINDSGVPG